MDQYSWSGNAPKAPSVGADPKALVAERSDKYGPPAQNFSTIANFWTVYIWRRYGVNIRVEPEDVGMFMALVKVAREANGHDPDNLLDIEGYARCARMILGEVE